MFYQDPFLLYQQSPFYQGSSPARHTQNRPSFRIDDILVPRQPFLVPKQPSFQESRSPVPNANPLKFGMHSILTQRSREDAHMFQGAWTARAHIVCNFQKTLHAEILLRAKWIREPLVLSHGNILFVSFAVLLHVSKLAMFQFMAYP